METVKDLGLADIYRQVSATNNIIGLPETLRFHDPLAEAIVELGEMWESFRRPWWREAEPDIDNVFVEMADVMIFFFTAFYAREMNWPHLGSRETEIAIDILNRLLTDKAFRALPAKRHFGDMTAGLGLMIAQDAAKPNRPNRILSQHIVLFAQGFRGMLEGIAETCAMDYRAALDRWLLTIKAKTYLNRYRTECGYKDGVYRKRVRGVEDNEVAIQLVRGDISYGKFKELMKEQGYGKKG